MNRARPDDYDVTGWQQFYRDHPGYRRSVGADADNGGDGAGGDGGGGDDAGDKGGAAENWRTGFVADIADEAERTKELTRLNRFEKPADYLKSYRDLETKVTSGELVFPVAKDADEETVKRFRERFNKVAGEKGAKIPLDPKDYLEQLPDGIVIGEGSEESILSFATAMHPTNLTTEQMGTAIKWLNEFSEAASAEQVTKDKELAGQTEEFLRGDDQWGKDYKQNLNRVNQLVTGLFGEEAAELLHSARDPEGREIMSSPAVLKGLLSVMREADPASFVIAGGGDMNASLDDEIAAIEKTMRDNRAAYNRDEKMQARYRDLLDARLKVEGRRQKGAA